MLKLACRVLLLSMTAVGNAAAQTEEGTPGPGTSSISVKTSIVAVTAVVRDKNGILSRALTKEDFTIKDEGKVQNIRYFDKDNDLPLRIGLMVDTSGSQSQYFAEQAKAGGEFLRAMLTRKEDKAFVVKFDTGVMLLQPMTEDVGRLQGALTMLDKKFPHTKSKGGTLLYDALYATAQQVAGKERGRRAVVVLTDGEDNGSQVPLSMAIQQVQKADVAVYVAIYTDHDTAPGVYMSEGMMAIAKKKMNGRQIMDHLAIESGGRLFVVTKQMPIEKIFQEVEKDMRMQYRLGFNVPPSKPGVLHQLEVKVKDTKLTVQARTGYYSPKLED